MRKLLAGAAITAVALVPAGLFGADAFAGTATKSSPPVKIPGKVTVTGTGTATGGAITLEQRDFAFSPTFVKVPAGTTSLAVTVKNTGQAQHTFTVPKAGIDHVLNPGDTFQTTVPISGGGVLFYCRFHKSQGMQGAFYTKKGAKISATGSAKSSSGSGSSGGSSSGGGSGY
jgi:plastocyanin